MRTLLLGGNQLGFQMGLERSRSLAELHSMWAASPSPPSSPPSGGLAGSPLRAALAPPDADPWGPRVTGLRCLDLSRTCLASLPPSLASLPHLDELHLCGIVRSPGDPPLLPFVHSPGDPRSPPPLLCAPLVTPALAPPLLSALPR